MNDCDKIPKSEIGNIVDAINLLREAEHNLQGFTLGLFTSENKSVEIAVPDLNTFQDIWEYLPNFIDQINKGIQSWSSRIFDLVIGENVIAEANVANIAEANDAEPEVVLWNKVIAISKSISTLQKTVDSCLRGLIDSMGVVSAAEAKDPAVDSEVVFGNVWPSIAFDLCAIATDIIKYKIIIGDVIYGSDKLKCEKKG